MNSEELRNKCYALELKENSKAIFNHNYSSFIIDDSFEKDWHPDYTVLSEKILEKELDMKFHTYLFGFDGTLVDAAPTYMGAIMR